MSEVSCIGMKIQPGESPCKPLVELIYKEKKGKWIPVAVLCLQFVIIIGLYFDLFILFGGRDREWGRGCY